MIALSLNLKHLRALTLIGRLGSLSAAGAAIGLSQPALTQALARLEQQFGTRLFDRLPQGMRPTEAGMTVLLRTERAMDHLATAVRVVSRLKHRVNRPELRLTAVQVRALLSLAENGSIAGAAHAIALSEPAVHRAIRELEQICETSLTERRGRRVGLTEPGRRMARDFALAMSELNAALQETAQQAVRVAIGAMALPRTILLPAAIAELWNTAPWAQVDVVDGSYGELVEALRSGSIDIVVGALRETPDPDLRQEMLLLDRITVIGRSQHPLAGKYPSLQELAYYPWIVGRRTSALLERWQQIFDSAGIPRPQAPIQCGSVTTIRGLLVRSNFLTLLSRAQVSAELEAGLLVPIPSAIPDTLRTIGIITRRDWVPTALQRSLLALFRQTAQQIPQQFE